MTQINLKPTATSLPFLLYLERDLEDCHVFWKTNEKK